MRLIAFIGIFLTSPIFAGESNYLGTDRADVEAGLRLYTEKQLSDMRRSNRDIPQAPQPIQEDKAEPEQAPKNWDEEITQLMQRDAPKNPPEEIPPPSLPSYPESFPEMEVKAPKTGDWQQIPGQELKGNDKKISQGDLISIPPGSFIMADLLTGVDAPSQNSIPALIRTRFGFVGPNQGFVDLSGCHVIAQATGDLSTERVKFKTLNLSCLSPDGVPESQAFTAYAAGEDDSFGVPGELRSRQGRVSMMAFLNGVVEGATKLVSETSSAVVAPLTALGGEGSSSAAVEVVRWYLEHAKELVPTIEVKAGSPVRLVVLEPLKLPKSFFKQINSEKDQSHETFDIVL